MSNLTVPTAATPSVATSLLVVVDTSVWISWLLPTDLNHASAHNWISRYVHAGGLLLSPSMLVIETASGISRATNQSAVGAQAARQIYTLSFVQVAPLDQNLVNETADIAATYKLRGADAIFVALAKREAVPLVSFDHEQLTRPTAIIATIRP